ncbi:MAG: hypothetical protein IKU05_00245 [Bacteroidales bacterium]|nr:hypothetical protein [Bacteroidales bacterium]
MKRFGLLLILLTLAWQGLLAQDTLILKDKPVETVMVQAKYHDPKKATLLALIPGAGQAYNHKYWKMPIVYAGFGATVYFAITNGSDYRLYRDAYDYKMGINTHVSQEAIEESAKYTEDNLITLRDYYRGNMELSWILTAAWYIIQVIDANVDAHFFYYDVGDDLTLQIEPQFNTINEFNLGYGNNIGLSLKLNF